MSKFSIVQANSPVSVERVQEILQNPGFGTYFSDYMAHIHFEANPGINEYLGVSSANGAWSNHEIIPFQNLSLSPAASVFHYGQEAFEGIKAFKRADGSIWTFRIRDNAERMIRSCHRVGLPDLPADDFIQSITQLVALDARWVPSGPNQALYIRPFMISTEPFLGVRSAHSVDYYCITSPVGAYFGAPKPVSIWVETQYFRAGPGGTGSAKVGGNYAASLLPAQKAYAKGYSQVLYLDAVDRKTVEELGGMSFFAVYKDGHVQTPALNGQILESITRDSIIEVLKNRGIHVQETKIDINELVDDIKSGQVVEAFACGTAAVVTAIGNLASDGFNVTVGDGVTEGSLTVSIRDEIVGIQTGKIPDTRGWCTKIK